MIKTVLRWFGRPKPPPLPRPRLEIERAHNMLNYFLASGAPVEMSLRTRAIMAGQLGALCWVLGHRRCRTFARQLDNMEAAFKKSLLDAGERN
jgi:hypothetical protein